MGQAACMDNKPNAYSDSVVTPEEKDHLENPGRLEKNVNMDLKKQDVRVWNGFIWLKYDK